MPISYWAAGSAALPPEVYGTTGEVALDVLVDPNFARRRFAARRKGAHRTGKTPAMFAA